MDKRDYRTQVLVVGAGMVGMTAALDLAQRGIEVLLVEQGSPEQPFIPRANHLSARTMEIFRQLGVADKVRRQGLPDHFPNDVAFVTSLTGYELARLRIPCRRDRFGSVGYIDSDWPTPEPAHRCNQMYFEPVIREAVVETPRIKSIFNTRLVDFKQDDAGVTAACVSEVNGSEAEIRADYMIGCDGGGSLVRKKLDVKFNGVEVISRNRMALVRAPGLLDRLSMEPAWMTWFISQEGHGSVHAIDGKELWCFQCTLPEGEEDFESLDRDKVIRDAIGEDIEYEIIHTEDWFGRRLIAKKFSKGRTFLGGDAAHIWIPMAGYGMNAGIADVTNLTWKLAAVLQGWGGEALLDSYEIERRLVTEQVSKVVANIATVNYNVDLRQNPPPELYEDSDAGSAARAAASKFLIEANMDQFNCAGLNFGSVYDKSPIVLPVDESPPPFQLGSYVPSTVPGCRTPHFTLANGKSLYDELGLGFALLRTNPSINVAPIVNAAERRAVPLRVVDIHADEAGELYDNKLVLSRPDHYVAWRGDIAPDSALPVIDTVRGAIKSS